MEEKQDYTEKIEVKGKLVDRIKVFNASFGYGYRIIDMKVKNGLYDGPVILWEGTDREEVRNVKKLILDGEEIPEKKPLVKPQRIIKFDEKHMEGYYSIPTLEHLKKIALEKIKERRNYFFEPEKPTPLDFTSEDIDNLPANLRDDARNKLRKYNSELRDYKDVSIEYLLFQKALEGNGNAALRVLSERNGHQYESFEIIDPEVIEVD